MQAMFSLGQSWNYPSWSLSQFFICWAIYYWIIQLSKNRKSCNVWACVGFIMLGISLQTSWHIEVIFLNSYISRAYVAFFAGGILYYLNEYIREKGIQTKAAALSMIWLAIIAVLRIYGIQAGWLSAVYSLCIFPAVVTIILNVDVLGRLLSLRVFDWLGEISLAIYLCNFSIELLMVLLNDGFGLNIDASTPIFFCLNLFLNIAVSALIHYTGERWLSVKLKHVLSWRKVEDEK